jgi:FlaG/FlaF family flagellin (archaellin)
VGVVVLLAITVTVAGVVATAVDTDLERGPPAATLELDVDASSDRLALTHRAGEPLRVDQLRVRVWVRGEPLAHQPPVPFFAATGFRSGPEGPFNSATTGPWTAGETATVRLAGTNSPRIRSGDPVRVTLRTDRGLIARLYSVAR